MSEFLASPYGAILIFFLRIFDVSLATIRLLMAVRGRKGIAASLGFVEILIWVVAVGTVVRNLASPLHVVSYAAGFAAGTYVGMTIEDVLALGLAVVRITVTRGGAQLAQALRELGFGVTETAGRGREGAVEILSTAVRRRELRRLYEEIERWDPEAFVTVEEPRAIHRGWLLGRRRK